MGLPFTIAERMGLPFTIAAGARQRSHSRVGADPQRTPLVTPLL
jgi:hypothetical protein